MRVGVHLEGTIQRDGEDDLAIEALLDATMEHLMLLDVSDPAVSASVTNNRIVVELVVDATSFSDALAKAETALRTAHHAAGMGTPGWAQHASIFDLASATTERRDLALL